MPFDTIRPIEPPRHNIQLGKIDYYMTPAELVKMRVDSAWRYHDALMQSLHQVLSDVDPVNIQQRRLAIANMQYEMGPGMALKRAQAEEQMQYGIPLSREQAMYQLQYGLPEQRATAQAYLNYYKEHPDQPWMNPTQQAARQRVQEREDRANGMRDTADQVKDFYRKQNQPAAPVQPGTPTPILKESDFPPVPSSESVINPPTTTTTTTATPSATPVTISGQPVVGDTSNAARGDVQATPSPVPSATPSATPGATTDTGSSIYGPVFDAQGNILPPSKQGGGDRFTPAMERAEDEAEGIYGRDEQGNVIVKGT